MESQLRTKKAPLEKDIFLSGEYIQYFNPDDRRNPFFKIYKRKKQDTIDIINESENSKKILDVGGGMGRVSLALAKSNKNKTVLTDISMDMLELVKKHSGNLYNIKVVNADAHQLPFRDKSFDHVVGLDLLCHLERPERALREFHRVLRDRGILLVDSTNSNPLWALFYPRYLGKNPLNWLRIIKFHGVCPGWEIIIKHYPRKKFYSLLHKIGFKIVRNIDYGPKICPKWHLAISRKNT